MAKRGRARAKKTTTKKTTRRQRVRERFTAARKSPRTQLAGRSAKNLIVGAALINVTSSLVGTQTARAGIYAQPLNLIIAGAGSSALGISGQKDLVSAGIKIGGSRAISTQIMPRLMGLGSGPGGSGRMANRNQGYGT
tara:strand:- start:78 stop:491 length:414 start_codon:yes stop_codon:yes gene_type:complete